MKVLLVNGSPHQKGCTYTALNEISKTLNEEGIETDFFWIGNQPIGGYICWGGCSKKGQCIFNDRANEFVDLAKGFDGFIFESPVHYASSAGNMILSMDRVFFSTHCAKKDVFYLKPAIAIVFARRVGTTATLDQMNKYFLHGQMPVVSSRYWNMVYGPKPEEVFQDEEGL